MLRIQYITTIKNTLGLTYNIFEFAEVLYGYLQLLIDKKYNFLTYSKLSFHTY